MTSIWPDTENSHPIATILKLKLIRVNWIAMTILSWLFFQRIRRRKFVETRTIRKLVQTGSDSFRSVRYSDWMMYEPMKGFCFEQWNKYRCVLFFLWKFFNQFRGFGFQAFWLAELTQIWLAIQWKVWFVEKSQGVQSSLSSSKSDDDHDNDNNKEDNNFRQHFPLKILIPITDWKGPTNLVCGSSNLQEESCLRK